MPRKAYKVFRIGVKNIGEIYHRQTVIAPEKSRLNFLEKNCFQENKFSAIGQMCV
jgi:hypothetical protein